MTHDEERAARIRRALAALAQERCEALPEEAADNAASIAAVPLDILPAGPARGQLLALAQAGQDVYAYQSGGPMGTWCLWLVRERVTCQEWHNWSALQQQGSASPA